MDGRPFLFVALGLVICCGCNLSANRYNASGKMAFESGQINQALNQFQTALSLNPRNADAYHNLASVYYTLGKRSNNSQWLNQSEQLYRQAIGLDDRHTDAHRGLACLLKDTNRKNHAFDLLNAWQQRYPTLTDPLIELARLHREDNQTQRAADLLADALRINGQDTRALKAMGYIRELQGQYALALQNYSRSYQLDTRQVDVAQKIGEIQTRLASANQNQQR